MHFVKKANKPLQLVIEDKVIEICKNPKLGVQKLGDLQGIFVYKFRFHQQEYLIAYKFDQSQTAIDLIWIHFFQIGSHENFYAELKRFLRQEQTLGKSKGVKI